ncbi:class I SAM-dependent methyltransferase [Nocardioides sp. Soil805]|uniref:class I SAM-dependent methyltransferase n=1 Tax=Nocardioides sp. Soil805 TaxID=1736416 RepID=UPI0007031F07|nr:class I SAM-dependent methyltransferase [Nocardioides sp. Soil805]KRF37297.1 methyltransferase type 11 [Nocardioides sp. Soil805]
MSDEQPTPEDITRWSGSFGAVAEAYDRGRPSYPAEAVSWLVGGEAKVVLELGAGTGKLTRELVAQGHAVYATDPDPAMLELLEAQVPGCSAKVAGAEEIPANDRSVDVVVAAQAFHWFDHAVALPEIARVLKPGGHLALTWNFFDQRIPWVRRLVAAMGERSMTSASHEAVVTSNLFGFVEEKTFAHWQDVNRETLLDIVASRSYISSLDEAAREARLDKVRALYDDYGRGHDGMQLAYRTECFRAQVIDRDEGTTTDPGDGASQEGPIVSDGTDTDMLLIDFR